MICFYVGKRSHICPDKTPASRTVAARSWRCAVAFFLIIWPYAFATAYQPLFTGPLLAPSGHVIPVGHKNVETYGFYTDNRGVFTRDWRRSHTASNESIVLNPLLSWGMAQNFDAKLSLSYAFNKNQSARQSGLGDLGLNFGYQLMEQGGDYSRPDVRLVFQQIFPAGKYDQLKPAKRGTDGIGMGSYQPGVGIIFQYLHPIFTSQYLRTRLALTYTDATRVNISGLSVFGGAVNTWGKINPGNFSSADLALEWSLTRNWVAVMEGYVAHRQATRFKGFAGTLADGSTASIGHGKIDEITLAPAIEYNFNSNVGIISGVWWTLAGKDTSDFVSSIVAVNFYW